jgi:hypothetical protein
VAPDRSFLSGCDQLLAVVHLPGADSPGGVVFALEAGEQLAEVARDLASALAR